MNKEVTYTQKEVLQNINTLQDELDASKLKRTEVTKRINELKKQIQYWKDLDLSQLKMF
jgi:cell division septum initiation protein DivIVA